MNLMWIVFPLIGGVIGWVTNFIAIKMLFYPRNPINFGLFKIQGVFPKRQRAFAERIANVVSGELVQIDEIKTAITSKENLTEVYDLIDSKIEVFLKTKLGEAMPFLVMFINDKTIASIKEILSEEVKSILPEAIENFADNLEANFDVKALVQKKVAQFPVEKFEEVIMGILSKELVFIEVVGLILGALIGVFQVVLAGVLLN